METIKKILSIMIILLGVVFAYNLGKKQVIDNIKIDAVDEIDYGIITLKIGNEYYDYNY